MGELQHIERVAMSVDVAVASVRGAPDNAGIIVKSWQRCIGEYGLEPDALPGPNILTSAELKLRYDAADDLLMLAREELERLFEQIGSSGYFMTMTDDSGVVVAAHCTADLQDDVRKAGTIAGSVWLEEQQGTNGIGTCLKEHNSLSVVMEEHFGTRLLGLSCTVAPIFRSADQILGVINVTTPRRTDHATQHMVRKIVGKAALRIENLHLQRQYAGRRILRLSRYGDFVDLANEARLVLDDADRIVAATPAASRMLKIPAGRLVGRSMPETLGLRDLSIAPEMQVLARPPREADPLYARMLGPSRRRVTPFARERRAIEAPSDAMMLLFGETKEMVDRIGTAQRLFARGLPVMLQGETGSGKTALARMLHETGARASKPFVTVNCAAIPQELIEGELFGHRAGAFTGANRQGSKGLVREADGGTLFLDEIGDMPLLLQTRLLHVLSEGVVAPLGGGPMQTVDLAVVSASLQDIEGLVALGRFRQDLFFRLNGATVTLPPLRDRADRAKLISNVVESEARAAGVADIVLSKPAAAMLEAYGWPGNLRELHHVARHAVAMADAPEILPEHLPSTLRRKAVRGAEKTETLTMEAALARTGWNVSAAARLLGISRATVHRHLATATIRRQSLKDGQTRSMV
jgi:sigma-54 dependent transcriptional regulator, acetoin dehydrogenase operon transcriptional activator AcoR